MVKVASIEGSPDPGAASCRLRVTMASSVNAGNAMAAVASSNAARPLDVREIMIGRGGRYADEDK